MTYVVQPAAFHQPMIGTRQRIQNQDVEVAVVTIAQDLDEERHERIVSQLMLADTLKSLNERATQILLTLIGGLLMTLLTVVASIATFR